MSKDKRFGKNQNRPTIVSPKSHHDLAPGKWIPRGLDLRVEKRLYPMLSQLDGDLS